MGLGRNPVSGHSGRRAGSASPDAVPRPPDISVSGVEGRARLAMAMARGVRQVDDPPVQADAFA